ncbi:MAG: DUF1697 domain-containing protein [Opitutaceae bacterium]|nr:DUF1697 domain-containing protein [Opitutaceae bacterium]
MPRYLAFLRGINLGRRRLKMERLCELFVELGCTGVETFIASGNVIFDDRARDPLKLAVKIEKHLAARLGYDVDTFVRTHAEVAALAALRPFARADMEAPENTVHIGFFGAPLPVAQARSLAAMRTATDEFHVTGREYFWLCRGIKSHESKVWASPALRALKLPSSSMRNLKTIRKLAELYPG